MLNLQKMFPQKSSFKLKATGKTYYLRPMTLKDQLWVKHNFEGRLEEILNPATLDMDAISRIIYLLLVDKSDFATHEYEDVNEDGETVTVEIGGYKLLQRLISSEEMSDVLWAFNETMGISRPVEKKAVKKKVVKKAKKVRKK